MTETMTPGSITKRVGANSPTTSGPSARPASSTSSTRIAAAESEGPLMVVPAGFIADIVGGLSGTIGEITGGFFGNAPLGRKIGDASSPLIKLLPFQVVEPSVAPQSADPSAGEQQSSGEPLVVVPAAFLGGLLGGIGGNLLGGAVGKFLGSEETGKTVGSTLGGVLGGLLPFQVVPPEVLPQTAGPNGDEPQEPMVVVPAGFFGNLLSGVSETVGGLIGGDTGRTIGKTASPFLKLLPFSDVPPELAPQSAGPDGDTQEDRMILVPAGFFGSLLSGLAGTVGGAVGGLFGNAQTGQNIGNAVAPVLNLLPFHALPPEVAPQSSGPEGDGGSQEELMLVPAGLFGSLLSGLSGTIGGAVGGLFGNADAGRAVGGAVSPILKLLPFQVLEPATADAN